MGESVLGLALPSLVPVKGTITTGATATGVASITGSTTGVASPGIDITSSSVSVGFVSFFSDVQLTTRASAIKSNVIFFITTNRPFCRSVSTSKYCKPI
jgi:ethanolamine utilization microcompartment shell protein EutS